jgi:hypothetical protein
MCRKVWTGRSVSDIDSPFSSRILLQTSQRFEAPFLFIACVGVDWEAVGGKLLFRLSTQQLGKLGSSSVCLLNSLGSWEALPFVYSTAWEAGKLCSVCLLNSLGSWEALFRLSTQQLGKLGSSVPFVYPTAWGAVG